MEMRSPRLSAAATVGRPSVVVPAAVAAAAVADRDHEAALGRDPAAVAGAAALGEIVLRAAAVAEAGGYSGGVEQQRVGRGHGVLDPALRVVVPTAVPLVAAVVL